MIKKVIVDDACPYIISYECNMIDPPKVLSVDNLDGSIIRKDTVLFTLINEHHYNMILCLHVSSMKNYKIDKK